MVQKYLNTAEMALVLRRTPYTIRKLHRQGVLPAVQLTPGAPLLFDPEKVAAALNRPAAGAPGAPGAEAEPPGAGQ
jgi:hypothetical protein